MNRPSVCHSIRGACRLCWCAANCKRMADARASTSVMRMDHAEGNRLAWAFGVSLVAHLLLWGCWYSDHKYHWFEKVRLPQWVQAAKIVPEFLKKSQQLSQPPINREPPLIFVDVSQAQAVVEPPKEAQYYSDKNSLAANPRADVVTGIPKIEGKQTDVPRTEDVPKTDFHPLQPSPAKVEQADKPGEMEKGPPVAASGDLALGKPDPTLKPDTGDKPRGRPRTLKEAMARLPESRIPGPKMHQEGGVRRRLEIASLDAKATPFGAYDKELVEAISQRWFTLLDQRAYASDSRGKVVLRFVLHQDGRVSGMGVMESTTGEVLTLICEKAVLDPAPFAPWPIEMRRLLGETRRIQFTFFYN